MTRKLHALPEDELAQVAGVSETTWKAHKREGAPTPKTVAQLPAWLKRYHAWRKANGKVPSTEMGYGGDPETITNRREYAKVKLMLARIEVGERLKSLVPRKEVVESIGRYTMAVRLRLNTLVMKMAARLGPLCGAGGASVVQTELQAEIDEICSEFESGVALREQPAAGSGDSPQLEATEPPDGQ